MLGRIWDAIRILLVGSTRLETRLHVLETRHRLLIEEIEGMVDKLNTATARAAKQKTRAAAKVAEAEAAQSAPVRNDIRAYKAQLRQRAFGGRPAPTSVTVEPDEIVEETA